MKYSIDYYGESYELPAYTLGIADKLEAQDALNRSNKSLREQCEGMYKTISDIVGTEFCDKAWGSLNNADPNELNIVYLKICAAYTKPLAEYQAEEIKRKIASAGVDNVLSLADKVSKIDQSLGKGKGARI